MPYISYRELRKERGWMNAQELADRLRVDPGVVTRLSAVVPPSKTLGVHGCWTDDDVQKINEYLDSKPSASAKLEGERRAQGYLSIKAAAAYHDIPLVTWTKGIDAGNAPKPQHRFGLRKYYKADEAREIAASFKARKKPEGMYSMKEAAGILKLTYSTTQSYVKRHNLGVRPYARACWLTKDDIKKLAELIGVSL